ncbi:aldo/keto reductase [Candidatus Binatia bacterium]|nr:aldo/keto reductase [Candidatus Binatia bacterium]
MTCPRCNAQRVDRVVRVRRLPVVGLYLLGFGLAYVFGGQYLHDLVEGVQRSLLPGWKVAVPAVVLVCAVIAGFARWRQQVCEKCGGPAPGWLLEALAQARSERLAAAPTRRAVLRTMGAAGTGIGAIAGGFGLAVGRNLGWVPVARSMFFTEVEKDAKNRPDAWRDARIVSYRRLGRTNAMVSDISLGSGRISDVAVARAALDRGITYFDTAPDYAQTGSERVLGEAMKGRRDKVFLATKFCVADGHLPNDTPVPKVMEAVEASLRRLQTDYVDLIHIHSCDRVERLLAPNIHEAFDRLKEQGKARFMGVSTHTPNLEAVANAAIDSGRFDVMMLAYHHGMWSQMEAILQKAKAQDIGIVAMKTLKGAKHENLAGFRDDSGAYSHAAFRWVLSNPCVSCLVISIATHDQVEEYVAASGTRPRPDDLARLQKYDRLVAGDYCQPHCGACLSSCPEGLPINDIMRYRMYFQDYGWEKEGMRLYARLDRGASACATCTAPCTATCPAGVPIREKMLDAHAKLRLVG